MRMSQADQCKPQHIANILWAFGTLGYKPSAHLLDILSKQATLKLAGFNPQNLANLIWAFARSASACLSCSCSVPFQGATNQATCACHAFPAVCGFASGHTGCCKLLSPAMISRAF